MKVLVACEFSGIVREAFKKRGHNAWSCDLLPTEIPGQHIQGDVLKVLNDGWDLMIAHPPCTYFANSGLHYLKTRPGRIKKLQEAYYFLCQLWLAPIEKICIENPVGWLNTHWRRPTQIIHPYYFGVPELKRTCLWLKNLPPLMETKVCEKPKPKGYCIRKSGRNKGKRYYYHWRQGKSAQSRSITFDCIANAMAEQWG